MLPDDVVRLRHMRDAAQRVVEWTDDLDRPDLERDEKLMHAVVRLIEIVGEAAKNVSDATRASCTGIPWRAIAGTRDRLAHGYFDVDLDIIWQIARHDLPDVLDEVNGILAEWDAAERKGPGQR